MIEIGPNLTAAIIYISAFAFLGVLAAIAAYFITKE